ncbi:MAG: hypothetical protein ABI461_09740, partial [Polyangiaceae bacterium]
MSGGEHERFDAELIVRRRDRGDRRSRVVVYDHKLVIDGIPTATRDICVGAAIERIRDSGPCRCFLVFGNAEVFDLTFIAPNLETARALLRALGVAANQRATRVAFTQKWSIWEEYVPWIACFAVLEPWLTFAHRLPVAANFGMFLMLWLITSAGRRYVRQTAITVGSDGIFRKRFGRTTFVAFSAIARVVKKNGGILLELRDGAAVRLIRRRAASSDRA